MACGWPSSVTLKLPCPKSLISRFLSSRTVKYTETRSTSLRNALPSALFSCPQAAPVQPRPANSKTSTAADTQTRIPMSTLLALTLDVTSTMPPPSLRVVAPLLGDVMACGADLPTVPTHRPSAESLQGFCGEYLVLGRTARNCRMSEISTSRRSRTSRGTYPAYQALTLKFLRSDACRSARLSRVDPIALQFWGL